MATIHITDQAGLAAMTDGNTYIIDNNIAVSGLATIPTLNNVTIDGQGYTISGLTGPLVDNLTNSTVQNLTLDTNITSGSRIGAIAKTADEVTIIGNTVNGIVHASGNVGGLFGDLYGINNYFINNTNNADVISETYYGGGMVGRVQANEVTFDGNVNTGRIQAKYTSAGGIAGVIASYDADDKFTVTNSTNYGEIVGGGDSGGIVGDMKRGIISLSKNYGIVRGTIDVGGIVGAATDTTLANNENYANVSGNQRVGGIAGTVDRTVTGIEVIGNTSYCGVISGVDGIGGIVGHLEGYDSSSNGYIADNKSFAPSIAGDTNVARIIGNIRNDIIGEPWYLSDNEANPDTLLTGNNTPQGGLVYDNQIVDPTDPQYGADQQQGVDFIPESCPQGYYLDGCNGCVKLGDSVVDFDSNGGSGVPPQDVPYGETATEPPTPTRNCDVFLGWYTKPELTIHYDFNTPVTDNFTLYAKWLDTPCPPEPPVKKFTVKFNSCGGSTVANQIVAEGDKAVAPKNPTRCGYIFCGWYLGCKKYDFNAAIEGDLCLTARWQRRCGCR